MKNQKQRRLAIGAGLALAIAILFLTGALRYNPWSEAPMVIRSEHVRPTITERFNASEIAPSPDPAGPAARVEQPAVKGASVELFGRIHGKKFGTPLAHAALQLQVHPVPGGPARAYQAVADMHGAYSILLHLPDAKKLSELVVRAKIQHSLCSGSTLRVPTTEIRPNSTGMPPRIQGDIDAVRVFPIEGTLSLPAGTEPSAAEVLIVGRANGPQPFVHLARTRVEGNGFFRGVLKDWPGEPVAFVAFLDNHIPSYGAFVMQKSSSTDVGRITLEPGISISGRVATSLPLHARARSIDLQGVAESGGILFSSIRSGTYTWPASGPPTIRVKHFPIQEDGSFFIGGLVPGRYFLSLHHPCTLSGAGASRTVVAPKSGMVIEETAAVYSVTGIDAATGEEVRPVRLWWDHSPDFGCWVGSRLEKRVALPPRVVHSGWLAAEGYLPAPVLLPALEPGTTGTATVPLLHINHPVQQEATVLSVTDDSGNPVTGLLMSIAWEGKPMTSHQYFKNSDGEYKLPPLPHGDYVVTLNANTLSHQFRNPLVPYTLNHSIPRDSRPRLDLVMGHGGAVVVALQDEDTQEWLSARLRISGPLLTDEQEWIPNDDGVIEVYFGWAPGRGEVRLKNALADGDYKLHVSADGFRSAERKFSVHQANDTRLEIYLTRE